MSSFGRLGTIAVLMLVIWGAVYGGGAGRVERFGVSEESKHAHRCPQSHPYPFNSQGILGGFCCRTKQISRSLAPQDYTQVCSDSNYVRCPAGWNCGPALVNEQDREQN